jgi:bifunctional N-acetylglucosamine-1-phosphate-uridyltransferase/glucosamine-1-phosphate-acetyltransferase GlmU-like protein
MAGCWSKAINWSRSVNMRMRQRPSAVDLCNAGVMAFAGKTALTIIEKIGTSNSKGEYYLTDAVEIVRSMGLRASVIETE